LLSAPADGKLSAGFAWGRVMVRRVSVAFVSILAAADIALGASAVTIETFSHDAWSGQAVAQDGKFRQCYMWMSAINNWDLGLALEPSGELRLGLRNQQIDLSWQTLFDSASALRIQIDQGPVLTKAFKTVTPKLVSTSLKDTDWEKRLLDGKLLRVNTGSRVRLFHLNGIKEAMAKLRACVAKHRAA
jgi:hypothetical protein